jgi:hypothetical protein
MLKLTLIAVANANSGSLFKDFDLFSSQYTDFIDSGEN